ncbi:MAG: hypothetical protein LBJ59_12710 [Zoogloeaceae bacterium]|jgi:hypothetical protein|nr:hypothetical protein [Zoogloeaceae bacterium]
MIAMHFLSGIALLMFVGVGFLSFFQKVAPTSRLEFCLHGFAICGFTLVLIGLGSIAIYDMCSNDKGYCRNWSLTAGQ